MHVRVECIKSNFLYKQYMQLTINDKKIYAFWYAASK